MNEKEKRKMEEKIVTQITNTTSIKQVALNDKVCVGCNNCGSCCMNTAIKLSALDIYRMAQVLDKQTIVDNVTFYFGENSHLPIVGILSNERSGLCPLLKANNEGDYVCILGDNKPLTCVHPFVAIGIELQNNEFDFIPFDQEVPKFDIDKYIQDCDVTKSILYFLEERNQECSSKCKKEKLVSEYLSDRIKYDKEQNLANIAAMLISRYVNVYEFTRILYLSEHSKANVKDMGFLFEDKISSYDKIIRSIFLDAYFYTDVEKPFIEQTIEHIHYLEDKKYPLLRILYKYFYKVLDPGRVTLQSILNTEDEELAQERFDNFFMKNSDAIQNRLCSYMILNMMKEVEQLNIKTGKE